MPWIAWIALFGGAILGPLILRHMGMALGGYWRRGGFAWPVACMLRLLSLALYVAGAAAFLAAMGLLLVLFRPTTTIAILPLFGVPGAFLWEMAASIRYAASDEMRSSLPATTAVRSTAVRTSLWA